MLLSIWLVYVVCIYSLYMPSTLWSKIEHWIKLLLIVLLYCGGQFYWCLTPLSTLCLLCCGGKFYWCLMPLSTIAQLHFDGQLYWCLMPLSIIAKLHCGRQIYWMNACCQQKPSYTLVVQLSWYFMSLSTICFIGEMLVVHNSPVILWWSILLGFNIPVNSISAISLWSVLLVKCIMSTIVQLYCGGQIYWSGIDV